VQSIFAIADEIGKEITFVRDIRRAAHTGSDAEDAEETNDGFHGSGETTERK
jgi:hypothetical protein